MNYYGTYENTFFYPLPWPKLWIWFHLTKNPRIRILSTKKHPKTLVTIFGTLIWTKKKKNCPLRWYHWYRLVSGTIRCQSNSDTVPLRSLIGGRVRAVMSGGAPLAPDTHDYLKTVLCCPIAQVTMFIFWSSKLHVNFLWTFWRS